MTTKNIKTEKDAALRIAEGKWAVKAGAAGVEVMPEQMRDSIPGPLHDHVIVFMAFDHAIFTTWTPAGVLVQSIRFLIENGVVQIEGCTKSDTVIFNKDPHGVFARLAVRLAQGQEVAPLPDTIPDSWTKE